MKTKFGLIALAAIFSMTTIMPVAQAQNEAAEADMVRQGELATLLVNVLGLYRFLPADPSEQEAIAVLLANRIAPKDGWEPDKEVTRDDLARVIVLAIDRSHEVENPDDPQSWIAFLANEGVPIDTVGLALSNVEPLPEPISGNVFVAVTSTDPLKKRAIFGQPDDVETGTDVDLLVSQPLRPSDIQQVIDAVPTIPSRPPRVTPH